MAPLTCTHSSCSRRGTWTVRTLSRKYRLISPTTVGIAKVGNCTPALRVEAVDGVDQPDGADLDDVLHRLVAAAEAGGRVAHEREVRLDERRAHPVVLRRARLEVLELAEEHLGQRPGVRAPAPLGGGSGRASAGRLVLGRRLGAVLADTVNATSSSVIMSVNSSVKSGHSITRHAHCVQAPHISVLRADEAPYGARKPRASTAGGLGGLRGPRRCGATWGERGGEGVRRQNS